MTEKERIMELYLKYGEREFDYIFGIRWFELREAELLANGYTSVTKLTPKALELIRERD